MTWRTAAEAFVPAADRLDRRCGEERLLDPMAESPPDRALLKSVGRLATYLQVYGDLLVETNRWDPSVLERFRASPVVGELEGWADAVATNEQLERLHTVLPQDWLDVAATGSAGDCARAVRHQFDLGVDGVIMHGATPSELAPVVTNFIAS